jgi:2'-5' RNA ligase
MPRLFTALEIPREAALSLSLLRGGLPGARWLSVENYHITLRFIGDVDGPTADEVINAFDRIDRQSFSLTLSGMGSFGSKKPHSIWAGVSPSPSSRRCRPRSNGSASAMACRRIRAGSRRM